LSRLKRPHVVIVGGGFAGLYAARGLARASVRVTLVDKRNYHLFRPMLYQVATGLLSADEIAPPLRSILSRQTNVNVLMSEVIGVDKEKKLVQLSQGAVPFDFLVLATGIQYNYFGHNEWKQFAPGLDSLDDAEKIRGKVLLAFEEAERIAAAGSADQAQIQELLTFVLVGAGTVGVEMAGTLAEMARTALVRDFRHIDPRSARIFLYEAGPRILPSYPEALSSKARRHLEQLGVLASPAARWLEMPADRGGRVKVSPDLSIPGYPDIFAIGDTALVFAPSRNLVGLKNSTVQPMPGLAQPAIQEGKYVANLISRRVEGQSSPESFSYLDKGDLAIVGSTFAVADLRFLRFSGLVAWLLWAGVHIYFLIGFANRLFVLLQWLIALVIKRRAVRVLYTEPPPS
jgi:NADH dehydrogenase